MILRRLTIHFFTILLLSICGCASFSKIKSKEYSTIDLTKHQYTDLNGVYSNRADTIFGDYQHAPYDALDLYTRLTILSQFFQFYPESAWRDSSGQFIEPSEKWIKLDFESDKKAIISMYHNEKFIFSKRLEESLKMDFSI